MQTGARLDNLFNQAQVAMIVAALGRGFYVIVTDDGGPQAAFGRIKSPIFKSLSRKY